VPEYVNSRSEKIAQVDVRLAVSFARQIAEHSVGTSFNASTQRNSPWRVHVDAEKWESANRAPDRSGSLPENWPLRPQAVILAAETGTILVTRVSPASCAVRSAKSPVQFTRTIAAIFANGRIGDPFTADAA